MESLENRWVIDGELKLLSSSTGVLLLVTWQIPCLLFFMICLGLTFSGIAWFPRNARK